MGKNTKTPVTIDDTNYYFEDLTENQKILFNHVIDLNRKLESSKFNLDQLQVGRDAFLNLLNVEMEIKAEEPISNVKKMNPKNRQIN
jgi:hypothetical protein